MPTNGKTAGRGRQPTDRVPDDVTVRLSYEEASLLVVGANMAMGLADRPGTDDESQALAQVVAGIVDKLYQAEPALKRDASRVEGEMQSFLTEVADGDHGSEDDIFEEADDEAVLEGGDWLEMIIEANAEGRELVLQVAGGGVRRLQPLGAGQIGGVAVAIGWNEDTKEFAAMRLDAIDSVRETGASFDDHDGLLTMACLDHFDPQPSPELD
jgi:hypothetical protein